MCRLLTVVCFLMATGLYAEKDLPVIERYSAKGVPLDEAISEALRLAGINNMQVTLGWPTYIIENELTNKRLQALALPNAKEWLSQHYEDDAQAYGRNKIPIVSIHLRNLRLDKALKYITLAVNYEYTWKHREIVTAPIRRLLITEHKLPEDLTQEQRLICLAGLDSQYPLFLSVNGNYRYVVTDGKTMYAMISPVDRLDVTKEVVEHFISTVHRDRVTLQDILEFSYTGVIEREAIDPFAPDTTELHRLPHEPDVNH